MSALSILFLTLPYLVMLGLARHARRRVKRSLLVRTKQPSTARQLLLVMIRGGITTIPHALRAFSELAPRARANIALPYPKLVQENFSVALGVREYCDLYRFEGQP